MVKNTLLTILLICAVQMNAQSTKTCDSKEESVLDLNSITKCSIEKADKNTKEAKVAVQVTSRRRVVRKRDAATGVMTNDYSHKLAKIKEKTEIVNNISVDKNTGMKVIPFNYVDEIPLFKNCESVAIYKQEKCFKAELANHIRRNLRYPENSYDRGIQGRVIVHFVIDREGNVDKMKIVSPYKGEELGKEAERIMKKLPKFTPGKQSGTPVTVKYGLPITFRIPGVKPSNVRKAPKKEAVTTVYDFKDVEVIPQFKSCNSSGDTSIDCFNKNLVEHIQDNFAYPTEAIDKNIEGEVYVKFVVNTRGEVVNIEAKGPSNGADLEKAAKELVEKLPEFKAAQKNGKKVNTSYSFPVVFKLN
jgi:TonB family protein